MLNWLVDIGKRNGVWKVIVQRHFTMHREEILRTINEWIGMNPDLRRWIAHLAGYGLPKLEPLQEYVPGFHGCRTIDLLEQLEKDLSAPIST
jgi:hypothetical protein